MNEPESIRRSPELMDRTETALLVIDVQQRLLSAQPKAQRVVWNVGRLLRGAKALGVTTAATEQVPEKLGATDESLQPHLGSVYQKSSFSAAECTALLDEWRREGKRHVLIAGIETHVCVLQSALDLMAEGFEVKIAADAVGSRFAHDHKVALRRLESSGVIVTTTEAALFEWCGTSSDDAFRTISALAKETLD